MATNKNITIITCFVRDAFYLQLYLTITAQGDNQTYIGKLDRMIGLNLHYIKGPHVYISGMYYPNVSEYLPTINYHKNLPTEINTELKTEPNMWIGGRYSFPYSTLCDLRAPCSFLRG